MRFFLHVIPYAYLGGTEKDCLYIIEQLKSFRHEVWVLHNIGPMTEEWEKRGATVRHLSILFKNPYQFHKQLFNYSRQIRADGIFYWSTTKLPLVRSAFRNQKCKMAVHAGNPLSLNIKSIGINMLLDSFLPGKIKTRIFSCSEYVKKSLLLDPYFRKFDIVVSLNPVEIPGSNLYRNEKIEKKSRFKIGMVARMDSIKDHKTVIYAFVEILKEFPLAVLQLIGDGSLRNSLEKLVRDLEITNSVIFLGSQKDVYSYLNSWTVFLYATTLREGLGNSLSEALANGLPCIATDLPMLREIDGDTGAVQFVKLDSPSSMAQKTINILHNQKERKILSNLGYKRAKNAFHASKYASHRYSFLMN